MAVYQRRASLGVISFGLAVAVTSSVFVFFLGLMATFFGWGVELAQVLASLYIGFSPSFVGTIAGAVWAFVDGFLAGVLIAWLYNRFVGRRIVEIHEPPLGEVARPPAAPPPGAGVAGEAPKSGE